MINLFWRLAARFLAKPAVTDWLIRRALKTPYHHLASADGSVLYMARYWLFNPYDRQAHAVKHRWCPWSVRLHLIHREDQDRDPHDHPWNARTVILRGGYQEKRLVQGERRERIIDACLDPIEKLTRDRSKVEAFEYMDRLPGDTAVLRHGEYHRIAAIHGDCAVTLFITGPYRGPWGFLVNGVKVPWKKYLGLDDGDDLQSHDVCSKSPTGEHSEGLIKGDSGRSDEGLIGSGKCAHCSLPWKEFADD